MRGFILSSTSRSCLFLRFLRLCIRWRCSELELPAKILTKPYVYASHTIQDALRPRLGFFLIFVRTSRVPSIFLWIAAQVGLWVCDLCILLLSTTTSLSMVLGLCPTLNDDDRFDLRMQFLLLKRQLVIGSIKVVLL